MILTRLPLRSLQGIAPLTLFVTVVACQGSGGSSIGATIDITNAIFSKRSGDCADYADNYSALVLDIQRNLGFDASVQITNDESLCSLWSNAIPNHDFNDQSAAFAHEVAQQEKTFVIARNPAIAAVTTALALSTYNAVMLNGVVVDLLAAGCYGVGDGFIGCFNLNTPWRYDPMSPNSSFGTDQHNAHTQPDGRYHYHGDPLAMYDDNPGPNGSPVIGFAADGFPIYGPYFYDGIEVRKAISGYTLKLGTRPSGPGGSYDGTFIDDYEYTAAGDLDECNGMTVDGQYGYYVTAAYPWILGCFKGTPNVSFNKF